MLAAQLQAHAPASGWNWLNQLVEDGYAIVKGLVGSHNNKTNLVIIAQQEPRQNLFLQEFST